MHRIAARIGLLALFGAAIGFHGRQSHFFDIPSLLLVVGGGFLVTLSIVSPRALARALAAGWRGSCTSTADGRTDRSVLRCLSRGFLACGVLGTGIGVAHVLFFLDNPEHFSPAMAVALLSILYGIFLSEMVVRPMRAALSLEEPSSTE